MSRKRLIGGSSVGRLRADDDRRQASGGGRGRGAARERVGVSSPPDSGGRPTRSTSRDLKRYARLFASRTRVMKSSAMRDLMAVTARPEVISLAGGLADTSSFP